MKTTLSNYEIILSLDDSVSLMVNGLYGAIDVVDRDEAAALSEGKVEKLSGEEIEGGCASKAYNKTGDLSNPYCGDTKEIFCETVSMLCDEQFQKTGERELTKSLKEALSQYTPEDRDTLQTTRDPKLIVELLKKTDMFDYDNKATADAT